MPPDGDIEKTDLFRQIRVQSLSMLDVWLIKRALLTCLQSTDVCMALSWASR